MFYGTNIILTDKPGTYQYRIPTSGNGTGGTSYDMFDKGITRVAVNKTYYVEYEPV